MLVKRLLLGESGGGRLPSRSTMNTGGAFLNRTWGVATPLGQAPPTWPCSFVLASPLRGSRVRALPPSGGTPALHVGDQRGHGSNSLGFLFLLPQRACAKEQMYRAWWHLCGIVTVHFSHLLEQGASRR